MTINVNLKQQMDCLFDPRSVAVIGASNNMVKWGFNILNTLLTKGGRETYAVNRNGTDVLGLRGYRSVRDIPAPVDLAVITVPYQDVPAAMEDCVRKGVKVAVVISGGLAESGEEGEEVERRVVEIARRGGLRFVGPNCMGNFNTYSGFSTVAYLPPAGRGPLALIAQSGNTSEWIIHSGGEVGLGFSKYVSSGNEADLHFEDYLEYLSQDAETGVVLGYVEGLREGRRFLETAKRITREKPVVLLKAGRTEAGSRAARSHTAALAGSDLVCDAAFRQSGVIRVDEAGELIDVALALLGQPLPRGRRVGVLATGGGAAVVTADALTRHGLELPPFSATTIERLNSILPRRWSHGNPIDNGGEPIDYGCLWALMEDDAIDAVVMIGAAGVGAKYSGWLSIPPSFGDAVDQWLREAERVEMGHLETMVELMDRYQKPVVLAHNGIPTVRQGELYDWLQRSHLVPYLTPERAAKALARLADYSEYLQLAKAEADQARRAPRSV